MSASVHGDVCVPACFLCTYNFAGVPSQWTSIGKQELLLSQHVSSCPFPCLPQSIIWAFFPPPCSLKESEVMPQTSTLSAVQISPPVLTDKNTTLLNLLSPTSLSSRLLKQPDFSHCSVAKVPAKVVEIHMRLSCLT